MEALINKLIRAVTTVTVFSVATRFLSFLFKIYISRKLGAENVGLYQICISMLVLLLSFTAGGLPAVLSRKIAEAEVRKDFKKQSALMSQSLIIGFVTSAFAISLLYALRSKLSFVFADDRCVDLFLIMLPAVASSTFYAVIRAWFWGRKKFLAFSFTEFVDNALKIAFTAFFASGIVAGISGAKSVAVAFLIADFACLLVLIIMFFANGGKLKKPSGFLELEKSAAPITTTHITGSFMNSLIAIVIPAQLVAAGLTTEAATATFGRIAGMALPVLMAPNALTGSLSVVLTPEMASLKAQGDTKSLMRKLESSLVFSLFFAAVFTVLFAPLGTQFGILFFNDGIAGAYISQCCLLMFPMGINQVTTTVMNSMGLEHKCFWHFAVSMVALLFCIFFLPKYIGVYAMAVGTGISGIINSTFHLVSLRKKLNLPIKIVKKSIYLILIALPTTLLAYFLQKILTPLIPNIFVILIAGGIGTAFYLLICSVFKVVQIKSIFTNKFGFFRKRVGAQANKA